MAGGIRDLRSRHLWTIGALAAALYAPASAARAEQAWVKDEVHLNVRTGPGSRYRILGVVKTGDAVEILERGAKWTRVRADELEDGWIPAGFLQSSPPAEIALARREAEAEELRERLAELSQQSSELKTTNDELSARDAAQRAEITKLVRENLELRAGARWPEWIAGAGILSFGMVVGAILHRNSTRRRPPRLRL